MSSQSFGYKIFQLFTTVCYYSALVWFRVDWPPTGHRSSRISARSREMCVKRQEELVPEGEDIYPLEIVLNTSWSNDFSSFMHIRPPHLITSHPLPLHYQIFFFLQPTFSLTLHHTFSRTQISHLLPAFSCLFCLFWPALKNAVNCPCYWSESPAKTVTYKCKASRWLGASAKHPHTICLCHSAKEKYRKMGIHNHRKHIKIY